MKAVKFMDMRISGLLGYRKGSVGSPMRLLVMESNRKATF
jgi:hypothetical protein